MKYLIVIFVLLGTISCRGYTVQPQQIINCNDPVLLEKILDAKSLQNMNFTIRVEGVTVEKKLAPKVSLK